MPNCKICYSLTTTLEDKKKLLNYYRCTTCEFVYLDDAFTVTAEQEKQQYDQHNNGFNDTGYVQMFEDFIDLAIAPYFLTIQTALDFGSGPGPVLSKLLEQRGFDVDIYDLYYAPKKVYKDKFYDLITSTEVFEHLSNPLEVMGLLSKHLNANGYLILMTKFPPKDDQAFLNWWYRRDPTHISFFTPKNFEFMAEKVGLKLLKTFNSNIAIFQKS